MSLSKEQFIKNSVWTFLELALYPVLMIVATPVFINKLGIEQYGLWMLITTITQGINVLNIGVGDTNIRLISKYRAESNFGLIKKVFHYNFSLSLFLFFAALLIGAVFYYFNFISVFYKANDYSFANNILMLACASAGIKFVEIAIISLFKAFERFDISSKLTLMSKNSVMLVNLALVLFGHGLVTIFIFTISLNFLNVCAQFIVLYKYDDKIISWPSFIFFKEKLDYLNYNFWYWLQSVIALLGFLADKFVVAYFTDVKTLGYYSIASLIGIQIHKFFQTFGGFIFPRVSFKIAEKTNVLPVYYVTRCFVAIAGWSIICFLILFGDFIFEWWLGSETFTHSIYFIQLYLVFESAMLLIIVPYHFINGTSFIKLNSVFEIIMRSSHFIAMLVGFYLQGANGILYGLIVATFINIPFQYFYFHKKIFVAIKNMEFLWVMLPVFFMLGVIIFDTVIFKLSLVAGLIISTKIIYFDTAKQYTSLSSLFGRKTG